MCTKLLAPHGCERVLSFRARKRLPYTALRKSPLRSPAAGLFPQRVPHLLAASPCLQWSTATFFRMPPQPYSMASLQASPPPMSDIRLNAKTPGVSRDLRPAPPRLSSTQARSSVQLLAYIPVQVRLRRLRNSAQSKVPTGEKRDMVTSRELDRTNSASTSQRLGRRSHSRPSNSLPLSISGWWCGSRWSASQGPSRSDRCRYGSVRARQQASVVGTRST